MYRHGESNASGRRRGGSLYSFLRSVSMLEYKNLLKKNGFSSPDVLKFATSEDLEDIGIKKGHALYVSQALNKNVMQLINCVKRNPKADFAQLKRFLRQVKMYDHLDLLIAHGFSSLTILKCASVSHLEDLGMLKGHAVIIVRHPKTSTESIPITLLFDPVPDEVGLKMLDVDDDVSDDLSMKVMVGDSKRRKVVIWAKNSIIRVLVKDTFAGFTNLFHQQLQRAFDEWHSSGICIKFELTNDVKIATFVIEYEYQPAEGTSLASSFFPIDFSPHEPQAMYISRHAFRASAEANPTQADKNVLKNVLVHELSHVLGLRHENWRECDAKDDEARRLGALDPDSITYRYSEFGDFMQRYSLEEGLTAKDKEWTRKLYEHNAPFIGGWRVFRKSTDRNSGLGWPDLDDHEGVRGTGVGTNRVMSGNLRRSK